MKPNKVLAALSLAFSTATLAQTVSADELKKSNQLSRINAPKAWAQSTGKGVTVAIVDSGIRASNPDLAGKLVTAPRTNFVGGAADDTNDPLGHGTHVAGIVGAAANGTGVVGVAPNASLVAVRVANARGMVTLNALGQGIRRAAELAPIMNVSIGGTNCCSRDILYAIQKGALIVFAAGNNGQAAPVWPARFAKERWANGQIIAVGAVDQNNVIASFSNRAGDTQNFFLVAPGTWVLSTKGDGEAFMSGTSMAAPHVAGAAALVKSRWAHLGANQIAEILFRSATDLGAPGVDPIYGRGLLNAEAAMKPIGTTAMVTAAGKTVTSSQVKIVPAPAYASAVQKSSVQSVELDEFGRDFAVDLSRFVVVLPQRTLSNVLAEDLDQVTRQSVAPQMKLHLAHGTLSTGVLGSGMAFMQLDAAQKHLQLATALMQNPALKLVPDSTHIGLMRELRSGLKIKAAAFTTAGADTLSSQAATRHKSTAAALGITRTTDRASLGLSVSTLNESSSLLGGSMTGFELSGAPRLTFVTAEAALELDRRTAAFAQLTSAKSAEAGKGAGFSATVSRASALKMGVAGTHMARPGDRLALTLERPLRVASGSLSANLPVGRDESGQLVFENKTIDLATPGKEIQARLDYLRPLGKDTHARMFIQRNQNPGHDPDARAENILGVQFFKSF